MLELCVPHSAVGLAAQLQVEVSWPWLSVEGDEFVDNRIFKQNGTVDAAWQADVDSSAPTRSAQWMDSLAAMDSRSEIASPPGLTAQLSSAFNLCLPSAMPQLQSESHADRELLYSSRCTDKKVTFAQQVSFWFPASTQLYFQGSGSSRPLSSCQPLRSALKRQEAAGAFWKHCQGHSVPRLSMLCTAESIDVQVAQPDAWSLDPDPVRQFVTDHEQFVSLACLQRFGQSVDEVLACGFAVAPNADASTRQVDGPVGQSSASTRNGVRRVEASAAPAGSPLMQPYQCDASLSASNVLVSHGPGTMAVEWFTMFGTVEGHQVLQKQPEWHDLRCIAEAISNAAPALARPSGRTLVAPLTGLFVPQVVLTRMAPTAAYQTIVCDLRPIGADIRVVDVRIGRRVTSIVDREGALEHLLASIRVSGQDLSFAVNRQPVAADFVLDVHSESVTLHWRLDALGMAEHTVEVPTVPNDGTGPCPPFFDVSGRTRWGSGSSWDHRLYRPLRPPTPPLPPDAMPNVAAIDRAILGGLQFTVFDVYHHKRILPRHEGQDVLDLVELALSLTPEIQRPWNHRLLSHEWSDWPSPQLVIWGPLEEGHRVVPIRNLDSPEDVCTVSVPADACPFAAMVAAERACPAFASLRVQVAREGCSFLADHVPCSPFAPNCLRGADVAEVQAATPIQVPRGHNAARWQPSLPAELTVVAPRSREDLWPVTEVVVHLQGRTPCRYQLPFGQDVAVLRVQVCHDLQLPATSVFRLPTYCPVEPGCPLHLYLHVPKVFDPWNDPECEPEQSWGLVDVRRCTGEEGVDYVMLAVPNLFDFAWLRGQIQDLLPDLPPVYAAYMGVTPLQGYLSPDGHTPLLTLFPRSHLARRDLSYRHDVLDTQQLTAVRGGCARMVGAYFPRRSGTAVPACAGSSGCMRNSVGPRGYPAISPMILQSVPDDDAFDHEPDDVLVFSPAHPPTACSVPLHFAPADFHARVARHVGLEGRCAMHIPMLAPLQPGHPRLSWLSPVHWRWTESLFWMPDVSVQMEAPFSGCRRHHRS